MAVGDFVTMYYVTLAFQHWIFMYLCVYLFCYMEKVYLIIYFIIKKTYVYDPFGSINDPTVFCSHCNYIYTV